MNGTHSVEEPYDFRVSDFAAGAESLVFKRWHGTWKVNPEAPSYG
jgi:hypothetical protein